MRLRILVVAVVLFAGACGDDGGAADPSATSPGSGADSVIALEVVDGDLVGGSQQVDIGLGDSVEVVVVGRQ